MTSMGRACPPSSSPDTRGRNAVTNVVHDHTSILATIEAKWNVPALTHRDANAATLADFLVTTGKPTFPEPPTLALPSNELKTQADCDPGPLSFPVYRTRRPARPRCPNRPPRHTDLARVRIGIDGWLGDTGQVREAGKPGKSGEAEHEAQGGPARGAARRP